MYTYLSIHPYLYLYLYPSMYIYIYTYVYYQQQIEAYTCRVFPEACCAPLHCQDVCCTLPVSFFPSVSLLSCIILHISLLDASETHQQTERPPGMMLSSFAIIVTDSGKVHMPYGLHLANCLQVGAPSVQLYLESKSDVDKDKREIKIGEVVRFHMLAKGANFLAKAKAKLNTLTHNALSSSLTAAGWVLAPWNLTTVGCWLAPSVRLCRQLLLFLNLSVQ